MWWFPHKPSCPETDARPLGKACSRCIFCRLRTSISFACFRPRPSQNDSYDTWCEPQTTRALHFTCMCTAQNCTATLELKSFAAQYRWFCVEAFFISCLNPKPLSKRCVTSLSTFPPKRNQCSNEKPYGPDTRFSLNIRNSKDPFIVNVMNPDKSRHSNWPFPWIDNMTPIVWLFDVSGVSWFLAPPPPLKRNESPHPLSARTASFSSKWQIRCLAPFLYLRLILQKYIDQRC